MKRLLLTAGLLFLSGEVQAELYVEPLIVCKTPYACNTIDQLEFFAIDTTELEFSCISINLIGCGLQPGDVVTRTIKLPVTGECYWYKFTWIGKVNYFTPDPGRTEIFWLPSNITWQCGEDFGHKVIPRNCNNSGGGRDR